MDGQTEGGKGGRSESQKGRAAKKEGRKEGRDPEGWKEGRSRKEG